MFLVGMAINVHADSVLRSLRRPGETGYKIPYGNLQYLLLSTVGVVITAPILITVWLGAYLGPEKIPSVCVGTYITVALTC